MNLRLMTLACCAVLGACAMEQSGPPPPRAQVNIFISPAGEPFRGGPVG